MAAADNQIAFTLTVNGGDAAAANVTKFTGALDANAIATKAAAGASDTHAISMRLLHGAIMEFGNTLSTINPQIGEMTTALGGGATMIAHLSEAMGTFGTALGLASVAITAVSHDLAALRVAEKEEADALALMTTARHAHVQSLAAEAAAITARQTADAADAAIEERIATGRATQAEVQASFAQKLAEQNRIVQAATTAQEGLARSMEDTAHQGGFALPGAIQRLQDELDASTHTVNSARDAEAQLNVQLRQAIILNTQAAVAVAAKTQAISDQQKILARIAIDHPTGGGAHRGGGGHAAAGGMTRDEIGIGFSQEMGDTAPLNAPGEAIDMTGERKTRGHNIDPATAAIAQRKKAEDEFRKTEQQHEKERAAAWTEFGSMAAGALGDLITLGAESAKNEKQASMVRAAGQATTAFIQGGIDLATAIGATVENPPLAATKYLSSAMLFIRGAEALAASGGQGGGAGASGGGGGGAGAGAAQAPVRPQAPGPAGGTSSGGGNFNFYLMGTVVTAGTHAEVGRQLALSTQAAAIKYGVTTVGGVTTPRT